MNSMEMETDEVDNFDKNLSIYIPNIEENINYLLQKVLEFVEKLQIMVGK